MDATTTSTEATRKTGRPSIGPEIKTRMTSEDIAVLDWRARRIASGDRAALIRSILRSYIDDCPVEIWRLMPDTEASSVPEFDAYPTDAEIVARLTESYSDAERVDVWAGRDHDGDPEWTVTAVWKVDGEEREEITSWRLEYEQDGEIVTLAADPA
jgi:hypothetical protein